MLVESIAIFIIFCIMIFLFLRAGKKNYAVAAAPLLFVPLFQVLANVLHAIIGRYVGFDIKAMIVLIGLSVALVMIGAFSVVVNGKRARIVYIVLSGGFSAALAIIFVYNHLVFIR